MIRKVLLLSGIPPYPIAGGFQAKMVSTLDFLREAGVDVSLLYLDEGRGVPPETRAAFPGTSLTVVPVERVVRPGTRDWWQRLPPRLVGRLLRQLRREPANPWQTPVDHYLSPGSWRSVGRALRDQSTECLLINFIFFTRAFGLVAPGVRKVFEAHDRFADRDLNYRREGRDPEWVATSVREEARGVRRAECILAIQDEENRYFAGISGREVLTVGYPVSPDPCVVRESPEQPMVLFVASRGGGNAAAWELLRDRCWPRILERQPVARLLVAGNLAERCSAAASARVEFLGRVPDLRALYEEASVVVNPVRFGSGLKIKNIEALAMGCPLVTTSHGAVGLGEPPACRVADDPEEFADSVVDLLFNRAAREALRLAGPKRVAELARRDRANLARAFRLSSAEGIEV